MSAMLEPIYQRRDFEIIDYEYFRIESDLGA